jgi:hypothetical protein
MGSAVVTFELLYAAIASLLIAASTLDSPSSVEGHPMPTYPYLP